MKLLVIENLLLFPSEDMYIMPYSFIHYTVERKTHGRMEGTVHGVILIYSLCYFHRWEGRFINIFIQVQTYNGINVIQLYMYKAINLLILDGTVASPLYRDNLMLVVMGSDFSQILFSLHEHF